MKNLLLVLMVALFLFTFSAITFAYSGSAIIPSFSISTTSQPTIYFSNITSEPATVKITFYNSSGVLISGNYVSSNITLDKTNPGVSVTFTLNGKNTGYVTITGISGPEYGHGIIEWSQSTQNIKCLISNGIFWYHNSDGWSLTSIAINNGLPF